MSETRLLCLSTTDAVAVVKETARPGDAVHTVRQDGPVVVIGYTDKRWPLIVASWAFDNGHAGDDAASAVIAAL